MSPTFEVEVIGSRARIPLTAIIDTGTALLADCRLVVDFPKDKVWLTRKPPRRGKR